MELFANLITTYGQISSICPPHDKVAQISLAHTARQIGQTLRPHETTDPFWTGQIPLWSPLSGHHEAFPCSSDRSGFFF